MLERNDISARLSEMHLYFGFAFWGFPLCLPGCYNTIRNVLNASVRFLHEASHSHRDINVIILPTWTDKVKKRIVSVLGNFPR